MLTSRMRTLIVCKYTLTCSKSLNSDMSRLLLLIRSGLERSHDSHGRFKRIESRRCFTVTVFSSSTSAGASKAPSGDALETCKHNNQMKSTCMRYVTTLSHQGLCYINHRKINLTIASQPPVTSLCACPHKLH